MRIICIFISIGFLLEISGFPSGSSPKQPRLGSPSVLLLCSRCPPNTPNPKLLFRQCRTSKSSICSCLRVQCTLNPDFFSLLGCSLSQLEKTFKRGESKKFFLDWWNKRLLKQLGKSLCSVRTYINNVQEKNTPNNSYTFRDGSLARVVVNKDNFALIIHHSFFISKLCHRSLKWYRASELILPIKYVLCLLNKINCIMHGVFKLF